MIAVQSKSAKKILADWLNENDPEMLEWFAACKQMLGEHTYSYTHNEELKQRLINNSKMIAGRELCSTKKKIQGL